jgi:hypothetical protein
MSLRSRVEKLEKVFPPSENELPVVAFSMGFWFPLPKGAKLKCGERIVVDVFKRQTVDRNWQGKGILFEEVCSRERVTSDPNDNGRTCEPDSRLEDVVTELYPPRIYSAAVQGAIAAQRMPNSASPKSP